MSSEIERNQKLSDSIQEYLKHQRKLIKHRMHHKNNKYEDVKDKPRRLMTDKKRPFYSKLEGDWQLISGGAIDTLTRKGDPEAHYHQSTTSEEEEESTIDMETPKWAVKGWTLKKENRYQPEQVTTRDPRKIPKKGRKHPSTLMTLTLPPFAQGIHHFGEWKEAVTRQERFPLLLVSELGIPNRHTYRPNVHQVSNEEIQRVFGSIGEIEDIIRKEDIAVVRYKEMSVAKLAAKEFKQEIISGKRIKVQFDPTGYYTSTWLRHKGVSPTEFDYHELRSKTHKTTSQHLTTQQHLSQKHPKIQIPKQSKQHLNTSIKEEETVEVYDPWHTKRMLLVPLSYIKNPKCLNYRGPNGKIQFCRIHSMNRPCKWREQCKHMHVYPKLWKEVAENPQRFEIEPPKNHTPPTKWIQITSCSPRMTEQAFYNIFANYHPTQVIKSEGSFYIEFENPQAAAASQSLLYRYEDGVKLIFQLKAPSFIPPPLSIPQSTTTPSQTTPSPHSQTPLTSPLPQSTPITPIANKDTEFSQADSLANAQQMIFNSLKAKCEQDLKKLLQPEIKEFVSTALKEREAKQKELQYDRMRADREALAAAKEEERRRREKARLERIRLEKQRIQIERAAQEEAARLEEKHDVSRRKVKSDEPSAPSKKKIKRVRSRSSGGYFYRPAHEIEREHPHQPSPLEEDIPTRCIVSFPETSCARTEGFIPDAHAKAKKEVAIREALLRAQLEKSLSERIVDEVSRNDDELTHVAEKRSNRLQSRHLRQKYENSLEGGDVLFNNVFEFSSRQKRLRFGRSAIHEYGLFACQHIKQNEMIIQYVGEIIRQAVADRREEHYEAAGIGSSYMFRLDEQYIIDATHKGNVARFINHSCNPNCQSKFISSRHETKIAIYALKPIRPGEEITFDYKFPFEEEKIPCSCGAPNCRKFLN